MNGTDKHYNRNNLKAVRPLFIPPDIPESEWCDFRRDYASGMNFTEIGEKYFCDPRTVKACIIHNKPSALLGMHSVPTKLAPYCSNINTCLSNLSAEPQNGNRSISAITRDIFQIIRAQGYNGCERTLRNYIDTKLSYKQIVNEEEQKDDQNSAY